MAKGQGFFIKMAKMAIIYSTTLAKIVFACCAHHPFLTIRTGKNTIVL
jgi:hypothetical protein